MLGPQGTGWGAASEIGHVDSENSDLPWCPPNTGRETPGTRGDGGGQIYPGRGCGWTQAEPMSRPGLSSSKSTNHGELSQ